MINSNEKNSENKNINNTNNIISKKDFTTLDLNNVSKNLQSEKNSTILNTNISKDFDNDIDLNIQVKSTIVDNSDINKTFNCLALTVKKDYKITVVKNIFIKTLKNSCRIAVSFFVLNFIKFFM